MNNLEISLVDREKEETHINTRIFDINIDSKGIVKLDAPDWVNVAVYNKTLKKWILAKERRHGVGKDVAGFMSGTVEKGEDPKDTALRELKEELGYDKVTGIEELYAEYANAAFMNNKIHGFCVCVEGEPGGTSFDEDENITPCYLDSSELREALESNGIFSKFTLLHLIDKYHIC